ncbi:MAG: hypothetical protein HY588_00165 [Candidatus Omnitrophica bacterium]|nr:hypothetical protein [Candidatus Omnitrophota bacterium]
MSIITDALKKAEREREAKAKTAREEAESVLVEEEKTVDAFLESVAAPSAELSFTKADAAISPQRVPPSFFTGKDLWVILGIVSLCFLGLWVVSRAPLVSGHFSFPWRLFQTTGISKVASSARSQGVQLPYVLSGISASGAKPYAIVNGIIVEQGHSINGAYVKEIQNQEVVLETRAGEIRLKLP